MSCFVFLLILRVVIVTGNNDTEFASKVISRLSGCSQNLLL